ncbi:MAG: glycogen/starch synthase [bacterium]|nr:glycogen/starch synthase [bacterium]
MDKLKVILIASELNPIAKVGGLADVIGALPKALYKNGIDVRIAIPKYGVINEKKYPFKKLAENIKVPFEGENKLINIYETPLPNSEVPVYLIDNLEYLGQNGIYFETDASSSGSNREAERYSFFARSLMEIFEPLDWYPDVIHCHDWHVGFVPVILKILSKNNDKLKHIKSLLTIHNLEYQGRYDKEMIFQAFGIKEDDHPTLSKTQNNQINSLQQAILTTDHLNTVSPNYAKEILTPEYGAGLEKVLATRLDDLDGILNGIDVEHFNPASDEALVKKYSPADISGKKECKADLQKKCGLKQDPEIPILGIVSRLADQKGIDLIYAIADDLAKENMQFVCLGTGDPKLEDMMKEVSKKYPEKFYANIAFDADFAQQIYAGADIFLMPSKFEPCGLGQMIAMRYGTLPIVRSTGGLKDTVKNIDVVTGQGDGFVFDNYEAGEFLTATKHALNLYQDQEKWYSVVKSVMSKDFSWNNSAHKYITLYKKIL